MSICQRAAKSLSVKLKKNLNPGGLEPGPNALAHTLVVMPKTADFFLRPPTLTHSNFDSPLTFRPYITSMERSTPLPKIDQEIKSLAAF